MPFANDCLEAGFQSLRDIPELSMDQCTFGEIEFTLRDPRNDGIPFDLTKFGITTGSSSVAEGFTGVKIILKEMPWILPVWEERELEIVDPENGVVKLLHDETFTRRSGIFTVDVQIHEGGLFRRNLPYFVIVNPTLTGDATDSRSTLSIAEIRMTMRDSDPEANFLIDSFDFKENEIALAMRQCVDYWNEARPPVAGGMTAANFPFRYHLSIGVVGRLHQYASIHKMRNDLPYSAGGVTVQDTVKWEQYRKIGDEMWAEWKQWVKEKKYEINVNGAFRSLGSGYYFGFLQQR